MFQKHKKIIIFLLCLAVVLVFFVSSVGAETIPQTPEKSRLGSFESGVYYLIAQIVQPLVRVGGELIGNLVLALVFFASWNDFITPAAVTTGWVVIRDISNMFFIVILLIIAFATILRVESYQYKKMLPRLLLVAILINFSKTICGLFIDIGQVIMLTFVAAFSAVAGGNFITGFGIYELLDEGTQALEQGTADNGIIAINYILALVYVVVAVITLVVTIAILMFRIVLLWLLVVLSPFAFFFTTFPQGQGYAQKWWQEFSKSIAVGPILAFFVWLSLVAFTPLTAEESRESQLRNQLKTSESISEELRAETLTTKVGSGKMGSTEAMISFIMAIGLMWGGIYMSGQLGGVLGSRAGAYAGKTMRYGAWLPRKVGGIVGDLAKKGALGGVLALDRLQGQYTGVQLSKIPAGIKAGWERRKEEAEKKIQQKRGERMQELKGTAGGVAYALLSDPEKAMSQLGVIRGIKTVARGVIPGIKSYKQMEDEANDLRDKNMDLEDKNKEDEEKKKDYNNKKSAEHEAARNAARFGDTNYTLDNTDTEMIENLKKQRDKIEVKEGANSVNYRDIDAIISAAEAGQSVSVGENDFNRFVKPITKKNFQDSKAEATEEARKASDDFRDFQASNPGFNPARVDSDINSRKADIQANNDKIKELEKKYLPVTPQYLVTDIEGRRAENEAMKNIPPNADFSDLLRLLKRSILDKDGNMSNVLVKEISRRGDLGDMLKQFNYSQNVEGLKKFTDKELTEANNGKKERAEKIANVASNYARDTGEFGFSGAYKTDFSSGRLKTNSLEAAANAAAQIIVKKSAGDAAKAKIPAYFGEKDATGQRKLTFLGGIALSSHFDGWEKMINKGTLPPAVIQALKESTADIKKLVNKGMVNASFLAAVEKSFVGKKGVPPLAGLVKQILS